MKSLISAEAKNKANKIVGTILSVIVAFALLYLTFKNVDLKEAFEIIMNSSVGFLILFSISFFLSHILRALRWQVILRSIKPDTKFLNSFSSVMIGYGVNCAVPRLGELYRSLFAGRLENVSRTSMLGTIVIERIIDLIFLALSVIVSVIIYSGNLYEQILWLKSTLVYGSVMLIVLIFILFLVIKNKNRFISTLNKVFSVISPKLSGKINYTLNMLIEGFATLKSKKNFAMTMFYSIMIMLVYGLTSYLAFYVLRFNNHYSISYEMGWIIMTLSAFGIVIPTPGGTGSYHLIVKSILEILYGFNTSESSAFALMTHFFSYVAFISSMLILLKVVNVRRAKNSLEKVSFISVIKSNRDEDEVN
ncbi:MAG: lysylphosphatidylglycerol synthase transmembrane domain-containing protein [Ignavibacteriales bacterium]